MPELTIHVIRAVFFYTPLTTDDIDQIKPNLMINVIWAKKSYWLDNGYKYSAMLSSDCIREEIDVMFAEKAVKFAESE